MAAMSNEMMMSRLAEPFGSFPAILMEWSRIKVDDLALRDDKREVYWAELVGLVEQAICAMGRRFIGTQFSTFSSYIVRLRGFVGAPDLRRRGVGRRS